MSNNNVSHIRKQDLLTLLNKGADYIDNKNDISDVSNASDFGDVSNVSNVSDVSDLRGLIDKSDMAYNKETWIHRTKRIACDLTHDVKVTFAVIILIVLQWLTRLINMMRKRLTR